MIIARIIPEAGIGNQMFMYAAGLAASQRLNTDLRLGAWDFVSDTRKDRPYHLDCFPAITEHNASFSETRNISPKLAIEKCYAYTETNSRVMRSILKAASIFFPKGRVYKPKYCSYSPEFEKIPDNTFLVGYFESEKIFAGIKDLVRKRFTFAPECFDPALTSEVRACESIAIHIRRGDKVTNDSFASETPYIKDAIARILSLTDNPKFFVFSDDISWCRENLPKVHDTDYTFIEGRTPPQDMALMTQCKHVIMGPSTFSWWGAWLNDNPNKIIIAPDINLWYGQLSQAEFDDRKHLLPHEWIKIS